MPLPGEIRLKSFLGRRYFGIPESPFVFLFFFDFTSYIERKNPFAVLRAFEELGRRCPTRDLFLVIKMKGGEARKQDYQSFRAEVGRYQGRLKVIDTLLDDNEVKNLVRCCDCFMSLHRSEGFGFGLTAAMYLSKPVIATGYSGNVDYMSGANSCLVRHSLCSVPNGAYPFAEGQEWAEPDIADAVDHMIQLVSDRNYALRIGESASRYLRVNFSYQATGLRYLGRMKEILSVRSGPPQKLAPAAFSYHK
jgi:glycosyltransferase involved in cell wall biosynthesis